MAYQRGDIVLIPFPFSDLSATKTRPAVVVSSDHYQEVRAELLLANVSSQVSKAHTDIDDIFAPLARSGRTGRVISEPYGRLVHWDTTSLLCFTDMVEP